MSITNERLKAILEMKPEAAQAPFSRRHCFEERQALAELVIAQRQQIQAMQDKFQQVVDILGDML